MVKIERMVRIERMEHGKNGSREKRMIQRKNEWNNKYFTYVYTGVYIYSLAISNCIATVINFDISICNRNINLGLFC